MFVKSKLYLAVVFTLFVTSSTNAQSVSVKLGNKFGGPVTIKSIDVKCDEWTCQPPSINGVFGLHDSLELQFDPITNTSETALVRIITDEKSFEYELEVHPRSTSDVISTSYHSDLFVSPVWPNPAKDNLSFNLYGLGTRLISAFIYDLQGKEIYTRPIEQDGAITLNLPTMPEGRYYFMLRDGVETITLQEIKVSAN